MKKLSYFCVCFLLIIGCNCCSQDNKISECKSPIYAIIRGDVSEGTLKNIFENPGIDGVTFYVGWARLNPMDDVYDFSSLNKVVNFAKKYNKKVNLGVLTGRWSPKWLENQDIQYLYWNHSDDYVENGDFYQSKAPIPWDDNFYKTFKAFLCKLEEIISPNIEIFNAFEITGGSNTGGIETNLICTDQELKRIQFTYDQYTDNWKRIIDTFAELFPNNLLTLAIHDTFGSQRTDEVALQLISYCRLKYDERIKIAAYAFTEEDWFTEGNEYADLVLQLESQNIVLQAIRIYSLKSNESKFDEMLAKASDINPAWVEIWSEDIIKGYLGIVK